MPTIIHEWTWEVSEWDHLPTDLRKAEIAGWEILCVCPIGEMERFVKIVMRRRGNAEAGD
jgi:hypothetical protein